ncbi:hypothetical protein ZIOFF_065630 [Zingiber officinale]|uniref:Uncharacterized protein n=1 Tax=Zingiber officinale TaxID=94328 RepID=A0A8J5EXK2_ZINOF|nr:hypothetical protein ZIOFF_065630 [Zingiber officinale]
MRGVGSVGGGAEAPALPMGVRWGMPFRLLAPDDGGVDREKLWIALHVSLLVERSEFYPRLGLYMGEIGGPCIRGSETEGIDKVTVAYLAIGDALVGPRLGVLVEEDDAGVVDEVGLHAGEVERLLDLQHSNHVVRCCTLSGGNESHVACIERRSSSTTAVATTSAIGAPPTRCHRHRPVPLPINLSPRTGKKTERKTHYGSYALDLRLSEWRIWIDDHLNHRGLHASDGEHLSVLLDLEKSQHLQGTRCGWGIILGICSDLESPQLYGPKKHNSEKEIPRHVKFQFRNAVRCRIVWVKLALPHLQPNIGEYNLFSFDENYSLRPSDSFAGNVENTRCIHAKRLLVFGKSVKDQGQDQDLSIQSTEMMKLRSFLDRSPSLSRFRIPIEGERLRDNDLVVEQFLSPISPAIAGFRIDAFNIIRPRVTHSPMNTVDGYSTLIEDRYIVPTVLYIQAAVVQESRKAVVVGEYRLPEAKAGTPLYFDFPQQFQANLVVFKLFGDITAFVDDVPDQDSTSFRAHPLASGLSLSNKGRKFDFIQALKLEIERLHLNLSAAERDRALLSVGIDPSAIDPNRLLDYQDLLRICSYADEIAFLGQIALEDKTIASIGLEKTDDVIDFWNISKIGESCHGAACEVRVELPTAGSFTSVSSSRTASFLLQCSICQRKCCKVCCAGKGVNMLLDKDFKELKIYNDLSSRSGSNHGGQTHESYKSNSSFDDKIICRKCCDEDILQALYVDYIRVLNALRRKTRTLDAARWALGQFVGPVVNGQFNSWQSIETGKRQLKALLNGAESLAEFPYSSLLYQEALSMLNILLEMGSEVMTVCYEIGFLSKQGDLDIPEAVLMCWCSESLLISLLDVWFTVHDIVETDKDSAPLLSLLAPVGMGEHHSYWKAPASLSTVEFSVVLGSLSDVAGVALMISSCGYSTFDCPIVNILLIYPCGAFLFDLFLLTVAMATGASSSTWVVSLHARSWLPMGVRWGMPFRLLAPDDGGVDREKLWIALHVSLLVERSEFYPRLGLYMGEIGGPCIRGSRTEGIDKVMVADLTNSGDALVGPRLEALVEEDDAGVVDEVGLHAGEVEHLLDLQHSNHVVVQIWASNTIHTDKQSIGTWDLKSLISEFPQLYGPKKHNSEKEIPRHVKFQFRNPVRCRIVWVKLALPHLQPNIGEYNLFSFDENYSLRPSDSFAGNVENTRFIHAKRLLVFGKSVKDQGQDQDLSIQSTEMMKLRSFLDRSPSLSRFRIPIEGERLRDNDLVVEQFLSPISPAIAGFRIDAFNIIRPRVTHSPMNTVDGYSTLIEDRYIVPTVLYIQAAVVQESRKAVVVGEYRLPEAKAGTPLYFDFPQQFQANLVVFKLLGDITAFVDDVPDQDSTSFRAHPLASGLSLSNKTTSSAYTSKPAMAILFWLHLVETHN